MDKQEDLIQLIEKFVDETEQIVSQLVELVIPTGPVSYPDNLEEMDLESFTKLAFTSSKYTKSQVNDYINNSHATIKIIRTKIKYSTPIPLTVYQGWVHNLDSATRQVQFLNKEELNNIKTKDDEAEYKKFEQLLFAYRSRMQQFNCCIIEYNRLKIGQELKPLAYTDVSPSV